jgi:Na+/H+ antiporter NhaD/arsenite permease-like protein
MPFVIGMFVMVESLDSSGWVEIFARGIEKLWTC